MIDSDVWHGIHSGLHELTILSAPSVPKCGVIIENNNGTSGLVLLT